MSTMATDVGYTYQPGGNGQSGNGGTPGRLTPQEALRILSFRVPKRPSQSALAPASLLPGAITQGRDASSLNQIISALMRSFPSAGGSQPVSPVSPMGGMRGGNVSFTPTGGGASAIPWQGQTRTQAPTFTPGDDGRGGSITDLFGQDVSREDGGGSRQEVSGEGLTDTFGGWLGRERELNGRGQFNGMPNLEDRFRF